MWAVIFNIPCTDDMLLFDTRLEAETWLERNGPWKHGEFTWGKLERPKEWKRL